MTEQTPAGRPRDAKASAALKAAAMELVQAQGYEAVSITQIIKTAGVSRQTLYNRWATKAELVLEAFFEQAALDVTTPDLDANTPRQTQLAQFLREIFAHLRRDGDTLRSLIGAAQSDPGFRAIFWERFVTPREAIVLNLLQNAQARGELGPTRDPVLLSNMLHGAFWYRLLNDQPLGEDVAEGLAAEVFRG